MVSKNMVFGNRVSQFRAKHTTKGRLIGSCLLLNLTQKFHHVVYFGHVVYSFWKNFPKSRLFGHVVYSARESNTLFFCDFFPLKLSYGKKSCRSKQVNKKYSYSRKAQRKVRPVLPIRLFFSSTENTCTIAYMSPVNYCSTLFVAQ